jgi:hypothetical protein
MRPRRRKKRPEPISKQDEIKLRAEWYQKLYDSGFEDIEHFNPKTGAGQDTPFISQPAFYFAKRYDETVFNHYRLCKNYASHATFTSKKLKMIWEMYCEGTSYRKIVAELRRRADSNKANDYLFYNRQGKIAMSLYRLHNIINQEIKKCYEWNANHPEGIKLDEAEATSLLQLELQSFPKEEKFLHYKPKRY